MNVKSGDATPIYSYIFPTPIHSYYDPYIPIPIFYNVNELLRSKEVHYYVKEYFQKGDCN